MFAQRSRLKFPPGVAEGEHPRRVGADVIAVALRLQNARQPDAIGEITREPALRDALAGGKFGRRGIRRRFGLLGGAIEGKAPGSGEIQARGVSGGGATL